MANITEIREQYPQYSDLSDTQLADALHAKFYSDIKKSDFYKTIGVAQAEEVAPIKQKKQGFLDTVTSDFKNRSKNVEKVINSKDTLPSRTLQTIGQGAGFLGDVTAEGMKVITPDAVQDYITSGVQKTMQNPAAQIIYNDVTGTYQDLKTILPETMRNVEAGANIGASLPMAKLLSVTGMGAKNVTKTVGHSLYPQPTVDQALGQVLQSNAKSNAGVMRDIAKGKEAFKNIDISKIKTYADLDAKLKEGIATVGKQVDNELAKDAKIYRLQDLDTAQSTVGGRIIRTNFVDDALQQLKELYSKTDKLKSANIEDFIMKAKTSGLTKTDVNNIARLYGSEYKAFNPSTGQQLTSVNAQSYEHTRKGLKEVARRGMDDTAKNLDNTLSSIMNTQRLIDKNAVAAARLRAKIDERGLGEKIGRGTLMALDVATFGTVKGAALKLFPRGLGYKVKNYIDLENALKRNLKIIENEYKRIK